MRPTTATLAMLTIPDKKDAPREPNGSSICYNIDNIASHFIASSNPYIVEYVEGNAIQQGR